MRRTFLAVVVWLALGAAPALGQRAPQARADSVIAARVEAAIEAASDLRADSLSVAVSEGVITITGSVVCDDCGGTRTPGGTGTVQQSLGAVVRAVPGVERVRFDLVYRRP
jgi:osmotically-inducible protein OsmY